MRRDGNHAAKHAHHGHPTRNSTHSGLLGTDARSGGFGFSIHRPHLRSELAFWCGGSCGCSGCSTFRGFARSVRELSHVLQCTPYAGSQARAEPNRCLGQRAFGGRGNPSDAAHHGVDLLLSGFILGLFDLLGINRARLGIDRTHSLLASRFNDAGLRSDLVAVGL